jgi:hypothetical protein
MSKTGRHDERRVERYDDSEITVLSRMPGCASSRIFLTPHGPALKANGKSPNV